jgi:putative ABC transport system permease protein
MEDVAVASGTGIEGHDVRRYPMIKHLCKLVWNRRRINLLITLEIFFSFLVVFAVIVMTVYYTNNYIHPLGFDYQNVWNVEISVIESSGGDRTEERRQLLEVARRLLAAAHEFSEVESVAGAAHTPYSGGRSIGCTDSKGPEVCYYPNKVTDDFRETMKINVVRGRWFGKEDDGASYSPVVINRKMARDFFGVEDPIGKRLHEPEPNDKDFIEERVIGVIDDFRKEGEFDALWGYLFTRNQLTMPHGGRFGNLVIRVRPGVTAAFEEKILSRLQAEAKDWSFKIKPIAQMREEKLQETIVPMVAFAIVAVFLMIMVGLGLTGVLWQSVTQRTKEIGLRRANGATKRRIHHQILAELFITTTIGSLAGVLVVVQFPLLNFLGFADWKVYAVSIIISLALIYLLTALCGLYPSRLATKVQPAEALHHE